MVVLLHGLFLSGWVMAWLAWRLRRRGLRTAVFSYPTRRRSPARNARELAAYLERLSPGRVDVVAHSLGGLVVLHLLAQRPAPDAAARVRRVVLLGPPLNGSVLARRLARWSVGRRLLGRSLDRGLLGDRPSAPAGADIAVIAGSRGWGPGCLLGGLPRPNDGTVALEETRAPDCPRHIVLPLSHMGLVFSPRVVRRIHHFLRDGGLEPPAGREAG